MKREAEIRKGWASAHGSSMFHYFDASEPKPSRRVSYCGRFIFRRWSKHGSDSTRKGTQDCPDCTSMSPGV